MGKIGISEQLIHGPPDEHDCLLGLPFFFFFVKYGSAHLSKFLWIFQNLYTSGEPRPLGSAWPLGCLISWAFLPNAGVPTRSGICHKIALVASSVTIWFSFNLLQRWDVQLRFLFCPEFQIFLSSTNPINLGLLNELGWGRGSYGFILWFPLKA